MLFGEIVEPSTRALVEDDFYDYPDYTEAVLQWEGNPTPPEELGSLLFLENSSLIKYLKPLVSNHDIVCRIVNGDVKLFKLAKSNNIYIVSYTEKELSTGQVIEALSEWIHKAKAVFGLNFEAKATLQGDESNHETIIRQLNSGQSTFNYPKLPSPNLVSGFGAGILSYCLHLGLKCTLFAVYLDSTPLDSMNTSPIAKLLGSLNIPRELLQLSGSSVSSSNLYF